MNLDKLTNKSREALLNSRSIALEMRHNELRAIHLLKALLDDENGIVPSVFDRLGIDRSVFAASLESALTKTMALQRLAVSAHLRRSSSMYLL